VAPRSRCEIAVNTRMKRTLHALSPPVGSEPDHLRQLHLHAVITATSPVVRSGTLSWDMPCGPMSRRAREAKLTAADLLVLVPWLIFAAGLAVIGWRLLVSRGICPRRRNRR
jgi:hypothetical protein